MYLLPESSQVKQDKYKFALASPQHFVARLSARFESWGEPCSTNMLQCTGGHVEFLITSCYTVLDAVIGLLRLEISPNSRIM